MNRFLLIIATILFATPTAWGQSVHPDTWWNPRPDSADQVLPLPGGLSIALRRVDVPGDAFWGDPARVVTFGTSDGDIFDTPPQSMQINGSFRDQQGQWFYLIGKYEVTVAQAAAILGNGDLGQGLEQLFELTIDEVILRRGRSCTPQSRSAAANAANCSSYLVDLRDFNETLEQDGADAAYALEFWAEPVAYLTPAEIARILQLYNQWLFGETGTEYTRLLDAAETGTAFARLPTELEWEYAAWGGEALADERQTEARFPFDPGQANRYGWFRDGRASSRSRIGLLEPLNGFYDILGNVAEVVDGRFQPERWQGMPGGAIVRGGSYRTYSEPGASAPPEYGFTRLARISMREEYSVYAGNGADELHIIRDPAIGFRIAFGSNVVGSDADRIRELRQTYREYLEGNDESGRANMPVSQTSGNALGAAAANLNNARSAVTRMRQRFPAAAPDLRAIEQEIQLADQALSDGIRYVAEGTGRLALSQLVDIRETINQLRGLERSINQMEEHIRRFDDSAIVASLQLQREEFTAENRLLEESLGAYFDRLTEFGSHGVAGREAFKDLRGWGPAQENRWALDLFISQAERANSLSYAAVRNEVLDAASR